MSKWVSLKDNGGGWNCYLNTDNLLKVYPDESQNGRPKQYFIVFRDLNDKGQGHVTFSNRDIRDSALRDLNEYLGNGNKILQLATDLR